VVFPESVAEVQHIVRTCGDLSVPIIPYGTGTSLEGHIAAIAGGITIDMSRMARILEVRPGDLDATVQAGVTRMQLNDALRSEGLFFSVDPGADASLGGMAATRASGTNTVRYGTMREAVLQLTAVLADGSVVTAGTRARKSSAGYDLAHLLIGSEGTLGIICELTVRLHGVPDSIVAATCPFPSIEDAVGCTIDLIQLGVPVARVELLDDALVRAVNAYKDLDLPEQPTLFFELHGSGASVAEAASDLSEIAAGHGGADFSWATDQAERTTLWTARHHAYYAALATRPGSKGFVTDVCVPISALAPCIAETKADLAGCSVPSTILGHVGDGNFHVIFALDPDDADELAAVEAIADRLGKRAIALDGTCTGEHGIGYGKLDLVAAQHPSAIPAMWAIKRALDPKNILNPGKLIPPLD
jgi:D-lactate dehydrogenase (cytochrome)